VAINLIFTFIYFWIGAAELQGLTPGSNWKTFKELFYFSTQTFTTVVMAASTLLAMQPIRSHPSKHDRLFIACPLQQVYYMVVFQNEKLPRIQ